MDPRSARLRVACRSVLTMFVIAAVSLFVCGREGAAATAVQPDVDDDERKSEQDP